MLPRILTTKIVRSPRRITTTIRKRCQRCFGSFTNKTYNNNNSCNSAIDIPSLLREALQGQLGGDENDDTNSIKIETNPYELERHGRGESHHPVRPPQAIVYPRTVDHVVTIAKLCNHHHIPLIPFGVGTSVEGHVCALQGGISLDTSLLQDMQLPSVSTTCDKDTDTTPWPDMMATVGAGVTRNTLNKALRHTGLHFVVDPGADATIGGMVATGASGTTAVHYGTMRENLLALQAVLPNGTVVTCGTKALKNSAGYDLLGLWCGSEGTLGIITSVTVKLHPVPEHVVAAVCAFETLHQAVHAVTSLKFQGMSSLTRCELLDASSIVAFNRYNNNNNNNNNNTGSTSRSKPPPPMPEQPTLFLEIQGNSETMLQEQLHRLRQICVEECDGSNFESRTDPEERSALWKARHQLYYATLQLRPGATSAVLTDACVPLSHFSQVIQDTAKDVVAYQVVGPIFGHAGDGNFHCILPIGSPEDDDIDDDYVQRVHTVNDRLIQRTLAVGGTCTGEHGVGYGKSKYLQQQYGSGAVDMMRAIKQALDPNNIMNPGKVVILPAVPAAVKE
jgi:D-lactate dehydrogenase (cytochrome)